MTMTINISLPKKMYQDAKIAVEDHGYSSVSELMRDALRKVLYPNITENGFTKEFEDEILQAAAEPDIDDVWETPEDIDRYFANLHKGTKHQNDKS